MTSVTYRAARAVLVGLAFFGLVTHAELLATGRFHDWWLPLSVLAGAALSWRAGTPSPTDPAGAPRWVTLVAVGLVVVVVAAIAYGSVSTPSRHWDGVVAWEVKADYLTDEPSIDQPYFAEPAVFCHTRDYPLLQPLTMAATNRLLGDGWGRLLFPILLGTLAALVGAVVRLRADRGWAGPLAAAAVVVTPVLANPSMGGADSGYGELFLAVTVAGVAAALTTADRLLLITSVVAAILVKPEGAVYMALVVAVTWARRERAAFHASLAGWLLGAMIWLPLQQRLAQLEAPPVWEIWSAIVAFGAAALLADRLLDRTEVRARAVLLIVAAPLCALALPALAMAFGSETGTFSGYLADPARPIDRLGRLPVLAVRFPEQAMHGLRFGTTFLLLIAALIVQRRAGRRLDAASWWTLVGLASLVGPFLLSPQQDLEHHVRSSMTRLLLHWLGALWIVAAIGVAPALPALRTRAAARATP